MKIILIGIQGSGKSTQGELLSHKLGIPYISTGKLFRSLAQQDTALGRFVKKRIEAGYLVPDKKVLSVLSKQLAKPKYRRGYILDGFPRTLRQAREFTERIDKVIYLKVSEKEAVKRLLRRASKKKRGDESMDAIGKRIASFYRHIQAILDFYKKKGLLVEINGEQDINAVYRDIIKVLNYNPE